MSNVWRCALVGLVCMAPTAARACLNAVEETRARVSPREIEAAQRALAERRDFDALDLLRKIMVNRSAPPRVARRIELLAQVATMRCESAVGQVNFAAYADWLHARRGEKEDPYLLAREAEALVGDRRDSEASTILEDLAARDVMPDAPAWQVLADVRARAGNSATADEARATCGRLAARPEVCALVTPKIEVEALQRAQGAVAAMRRLLTEGVTGLSANGVPRRITHAPDVIPGALQVNGPLDREIVRRIIRRHLNEVRFCYERELMKQPVLDGRVQVQFTISGEGQVVASAVQSSTLSSPPVEECIAAAHRRWEFPKPAGGGQVIVSAPFALKRAGDDSKLLGTDF
jgi:hypothetical protein